tara:strand:+ start:768 stop:1280 length:513 start_codon:yes stop_codon:yes gene_type:complete
MINIKKFLIIFLFFFLNIHASSADQKIVYLNLDAIVQNSVPGKLILEQLDTRKNKDIENFKLREKRLRDKEIDIIKKKNIISKEEFENQVSLLRNEMNIYNEEKEKIFLEFEKNKNKKLNVFLEKITPIIENFVKDNSINIVLNEKNLFIASKKFDITDEIIELVNKTIK